ncbi:MAG: DUF4126 domain-containing protein [Acidobacteriota bacterium]|jgi:hypothetical protein
MTVELLDPELLLHAGLGIALAAAAGFRIFVPLLVLSAAALSGRVELTGGLEWMGSWPALIVFAVATVVEIAGYYVPWVDNVLDWLGAPLAVIAGTLLAASTLGDADPLLRWVLAVVAGGGAAGAVHALTALLRKLSSLATGGLANPVLSTAEAGGSLALSLLALVLPLLALGVLVAAVVLALRVARRRRAAAQTS